MQKLGLITIFVVMNSQNLVIGRVIYILVCNFIKRLILLLFVLFFTLDYSQVMLSFHSTYKKISCQQQVAYDENNQLSEETKIIIQRTATISHHSLKLIRLKLVVRRRRPFSYKPNCIGLVQLITDVLLIKLHKHICLLLQFFFYLFMLKQTSEG